MYLPSALLLPLLAASALANYRVNGTTYGVNSDLLATPLVPGARVMNDVYTGCQQLNEKGEQISKGEECVWNGLQYMIHVLGLAHNAIQAVALLNNTVSGVQALPFPTNRSIASSSSLNNSPSATGSISLPILERRYSNNRQALLDELNDQISRRSEDGRGPRAVQVSDSEIHPMDGLAIRTNVHSGDATLYMHTNGSHATAAFKKDVFPSLGRRNTVFVPQTRHQFEKNQGIKIQIRVAERADYKKFDTLLSDLAHGKDGRAPRLKDSDSWSFSMCEESYDIELLRAKLVAEDDGAGYDFESGGENGCKVKSSDLD
jgi:hypothetical protein